MDARKKYIIISLIVIIITFCSINVYIYRTKQIENENVQIYYQNLMNNMNNYVSYLENQNDELDEKLKNTTELLDEIKIQLDLQNISLTQNISELEKLKSGDNYDLHDPTYNEVLNFIQYDRTNEEPYIEDVFDCEQFSQQVNTNAENIGIRCAYVIIYFYDTDTGHGIVGFNTVDKGMVYIEPQSDEWVENLEIGNDFWTDCIIPNGNYYYEDSPDDTIKEILLFW